MKRVLTIFSAAAFLVGVCYAQTSASSQDSAAASQGSSVSAGPAAAQSTNSANASQKTQVSEKGKSARASSETQLQSGSTIHATLAKPVDARKCKAGDEVIAKTTENVKSANQVVIPKGSKILGHVTEVKTRAKGQDESEVGIAFDRAVLKDGREIPLAVTLQAIGNAQAATSAAMEDSSAMDRGGAGGMAPPAAGHQGGGLLGGVGSTAGNVANTASNTASGAAASASSTAVGPLSSNSQGVIGLSGLSLSAEASNSTQGSVISSKTGNVKLDSGTEMILRVNSQ